MSDSATLIEIRRLLEAGVDAHFIAGAATAIPVANTFVNINVDENGAAAAEALPNNYAHLWTATALIVGAGGAPVNVTWQWFESDPASGIAVTPMITTALLPTSLTAGTIAARIDAPFLRIDTGAGTEGRLICRVTADQTITTFQPFLIYVAKLKTPVAS